MQFPKYLLSHQNNSLVDSSSPATKHLSLLPVLGNSLILWVLGRTRDLLPLWKLRESRYLFPCHSLAARAPVCMLGSAIWMPPPGTLYLEQVVQRQEDGPRWSPPQGLGVWQSLGSEPLVAAVPATGHNQTFPGTEPALTSQLPSLP